MLSPTSVSFPNPQFPCPAADYSTTFTASETGYSGQFTATSQSPGSVSVSPGSSSGLFTVTTPIPPAPSPPPSTTVTVRDTLGDSAVFQVNFNLICLP